MSPTGRLALHLLCSSISSPRPLAAGPTAPVPVAIGKHLNEKGDGLKEVIP